MDGSWSPAIMSPCSRSLRGGGRTPPWRPDSCTVHYTVQIKSAVHCTVQINNIVQAVQLPYLLEAVESSARANLVCGLTFNFVIITSKVGKC